MAWRGRQGKEIRACLSTLYPGQVHLSGGRLVQMRFRRFRTSIRSNLIYLVTPRAALQGLRLRTRHVRCGDNGCINTFPSQLELVARTIATGAFLGDDLTCPRCPNLAVALALEHSRLLEMGEGVQLSYRMLPDLASPS